MIGLKSALATFFSERAEWRRQEAMEHPEDAGISRNAEGLEALAEWVQGLDDADPRLRQLAAHDCWDEGLDVFAAEEEGGREAGLYRFSTADETPDHFLDAFVQACIQDDLANDKRPFSDV